MSINLHDAERLFAETMAKHLAELAHYGEADIVIGIPFYNEEDELVKGIAALQQGLKAYCPGCRTLIVCVGTHVGEQTLARLAESKVLSGEPQTYAFLLDHPDLVGKGWGVKALLKIASALHGDLAIFEADFVTSLQDLASEEWLRLLLDPIRKSGYELTLGCFERHPFRDSLALNLVSPLIAATYGFHISDPLGDEMALSNNLVNKLVAKGTTWFEDVYHYGIGVWIVTTALANGMAICESSLGAKQTRRFNGKQEVVAHQIIRTLFRQIAEHYKLWSKQGEVLRYPATVGVPCCSWAMAEKPDFAAAFAKFRDGFNASTANMLKKILPEEAYAKLNFLVEAPREQYAFPDELWAEVLFHLLLAVTFRSEYTRDDLVNAVIAMLHGRRAHTALNLDAIQSRLLVDLAENRNLLALLVSQETTQQIRYFHGERHRLIAQWEHLAETSRPVLPKVAFWEFIPGVPMTLPQEVTSSTGRTVSLIPIYEHLLRDYRQRFAAFCTERLGLPEDAPSSRIVAEVTDFMYSLEWRTKEHLLPGNFTTLEGCERNVRILFDLAEPITVLALTDAAIIRALTENPPVHVLTKYECKTVRQLLAKLAPREAFALATCVEEQDYLQTILSWVRKNTTIDDFTERRLEPLVVPNTLFYGPSEMRDTTRLSRLAGMLVLTNLAKHSGGEYRTLRYLTAISKSMTEAEVFTQIWRQFAAGRERDFVGKVVNSLTGHWGNALFAAHNIFEAKIHQLYTARLREAVIGLREKSSDPEYRRFCEDLVLALEIYPLAVTLGDGQFIPLSIWTWSSYSYRGGKGVPGPLSLHVERDWFSREILVRANAALEEPTSIDEVIIDLMARGNESADLAEFLWPVQHDPKELFEETYVQQVAYPEAGQLVRFEGNPILSPIKEHDWESTYVLNNAAFRLDGKIYLLYRAFGKDSISRIGMAVTRDGFHIDERLPEPIFWPELPEESAGCEDPRVVQIGDRLYMTYTAYDLVVPQIAIASISVEDFLARRWDKWHRHGMTFPNFPNKDAIIFPEKINGKYAMYHRVAPSIWLSYADEIVCPWPKGPHKIVMGPRYGMLWDAIKIGAGAQPLKTRHGWLLIYHGVDYAIRYSLGVMLVALDDPGNLLYRSPNTILTPEEEYEKGVRGQVWVPNVVFTCGAVPARDTDLLEDDDEILVYYGAADTFVAVAKAKVSDLIPEEIRKSK